MSRTEGLDQGKENLFLQRFESSLGERILLQGMTLHLRQAETKIIHTSQNFLGDFGREGWAGVAPQGAAAEPAPSPAPSPRRGPGASGTSHCGTADAALGGKKPAQLILAV